MYADTARKLTIRFVSAIQTNTFRSSLSSTAKPALKTSLPPPVIYSSRFSLYRCFVNNSGEGDLAKDVEDDLTLSNLNFQASSESGESDVQFTTEINSILYGIDSDLPEAADYCEKTRNRVIDNPLLNKMTHSNQPNWKNLTRERKRIFVSKRIKGGCIDKLIQKCGHKSISESVADVLDKLGQRMGLEGYNSLLKALLDSAVASEDEKFSLEQMTQALYIFNKMIEQGFHIEEDTYQPIFMYLIERGMIEKFHEFCKVIRDNNLCSISRLAYYELLLWLAVRNEKKIKELLNNVAVNDDKDNSELQESFILALCEYDQKEELVQLMEHMDITKLSLTDSAKHVFKSLGRLQLEPYAEKFLLAFKKSGCDADKITNFIGTYVTGSLNSPVEDVVKRFKELHKKLDVSPSASSYAILIQYACESLKVHVALDLFNELCELNLCCSIGVLNSILGAAEEAFEYNLVRRAYSLISCYNLVANTETYRMIITLLVRMKDFAGAYKVLDDVKKANLDPTSQMYNALMRGYFREKNISGALMVFEKMKKADVKPNAVTYSYLINNSKTEEDIAQYHEELRQSKLPITKHVYMALVNAYAACGEFEKAKQVVTCDAILDKNLNEMKSVLVSALASHGRMSEALAVREEIKKTGHYPEPKAIISLIEYASAEGGKPTKEELQKMLQLLQELHDSEYWIDGCLRTILYCVRNKHINTACGLFKQLKDKLLGDEIRMEVFFDEVFCLIGESEPSLLEFGEILLRFMNKKLKITPSRKSLDFLLDACVKARDLKTAHFIWKEYKVADLPYNGISFLRMYQALLASGDHKAAKVMLDRIPKDDCHIRLIIKECQKTYKRSMKKKEQKRSQ